MNEIIDDIALALSHQCRFGGYTPYFYSKAEHSVRVAEEAQRRGADRVTVLAALLHDAEEAYLPDIPRPIKADMPEAQRIYKNIDEAIVIKFDLQKADWELIKEIDSGMCLTEAKKFDLWSEDWADLGKPIVTHGLFGWTPMTARANFMNMFRELTVSECMP